MPNGCLANDLMVFYAPKEVYEDKMTVMEMICCSVCITSMICFSLEVKYGSLFSTHVHMYRHRVCTEDGYWCMGKMGKSRGEVVYGPEAELLLL